MQAPDQKK